MHFAAGGLKPCLDHQSLLWTFESLSYKHHTQAVQPQRYSDLSWLLQALEKLSHEHPAACLRHGGLLATLSYLDFFQTGVQRVAVATAANMCRCLTSENTEAVSSAVPMLTSLLQYSVGGLQSASYSQSCPRTNGCIPSPQPCCSHRRGFTLCNSPAAMSLYLAAILNMGVLHTALLLHCGNFSCALWLLYPQRQS